MTAWWPAGASIADAIAPLWFLGSWAGYTLYADRLHGRRNLVQTLHAYRRVFAYALFKFNWADRHYNHCLIMLGSVAPPGGLVRDSELYAERLATIATGSARHYNRGIRAFGPAALGWFIHPWLLVLLSTWVVLVL